MESREVADPQQFLQLLTELAAQTEARHNLMFGIAGSLVADPKAYEVYRLWVAEEGGRPVGAALITSPWHLVVSDEGARGAADSLAEAVLAGGLGVRGAVGNRPAIDHFVSAWTRLADCSLELVMAQGVFALESVRAVPRTRGGPRPAVDADRELLVAWIDAFHQEAFTTPPPVAGAEIVDRVLGGERSQFWLWEVGGRPVSLSGHGRRTPSGIRIGPVYTPPEHRRKGYATSLVAEQSQWLLEQGHRFCFLNTDLANPSSNAIYQRIGYEQVAEAAQYRFVR